MSLLSAAEQEIEKIFKLALVKKYVTAKIEDDDDEVELPEKEEDQTEEEWRDACVDAKAAAKRADCIFRADTKKKMDEITELGAKLLVPGAPYVVFEGTLSEKAFNAYKEDYGKPCTPKSVDYSLRHLAKKKHGEVKQAQPTPSPNRNRGQQAKRGRQNGRGGYRQGGGGGFRYGNAPTWNGPTGFMPNGPWRPGFSVY